MGTNAERYRPDHVTTNELANENSNSTSGLASDTTPIEIKPEDTENEMPLPNNADASAGEMSSTSNQ